MRTLDRYKQNLHIDGNKVISYTTHVATIDNTNKTLTVLGYWSVTTSKHINYVARVMGLTLIDSSKFTEYQKMASEFKKMNSIEDLKHTKIGMLSWDISSRGGYVGFFGSDVAKFLSLEATLLPHKVGAYCNYLGGGVRGSIVASEFSRFIPEDKAEVLYEISDACIRAYKNAEGESGMNDDIDEDGDTNWEALGTQAARDAGIESAY